MGFGEYFNTCLIPVGIFTQVAPEFSGTRNALVQTKDMAGDMVQMCAASELPLGVGK